MSVNSTIDSLKISTLPISDIEIQGSRCRAMNDSGAEVPLISDQLVSKLDVEVCGHINIRGVIGESMRIPLVSVIMKPSVGLNAVNVEEGVQVVCGVAPINTPDYDVILPPDVFAEIESLPVAQVICVSVHNAVDEGQDGDAMNMLLLITMFVKMMTVMLLLRLRMRLI